MYEIFARLCEEHNVSPHKVSQATGIGDSTFTDWKKGRSSPKAEKLKKIADYFGVTVEYLRDGEESQGYYLNEETAQMAQEMYEDRDMRSLFHMKRNMAPEDFKTHIDFMKQLYKREHPDDDF